MRPHDLQYFFDDIEDYTSPESFRRGLAYYKSGRVLDCVVEGGTAKGRVMGSSPRPYQVSFEFDEDGIVEADCSCPVGYGCKHVAALALKVFSEPSASAGSRIVMSPVAADPHWSKTLENLLPSQNSPGFQSRKGELQLVLALNSISSHHFDAKNHSSQLELQIRPRVFYPGINTVSSTDVRWEDASHNLRPSKYSHLSEEHSWFFSQMALALNLRGAYQGASRWASVTNENAQAVWDILRSHKNHHVDLLFGERSYQPEQIRDDVLSMKIKISDEQGGIRLSADLFLGSAPLTHPAVMIGEPAVFGVLSSPLDTNYPDADASQILSIHPAKQVHSKTFLSLGSKPVHIPKMEIPSFVSRWAGELARDFDVDNQSALVVLPERFSLRSLVSVHSVPEGRFQIVLGWKYGNHQVPFFSNDGKIHVRRSPDAEMVLRRKLESLLCDFEPFWDINRRHGSRQLKTAVLLGAEAAVDFILRVFPRLENHPEIVVQKDPAADLLALDQTSVQTALFMDDDENKTDWFDLRVEITVGEHQVPLEKILPALAAKAKYYFLSDGKYFSLDTPFFDRLRELMRQADSLMDVQKGVFKLTRFQTGWWDELQKLGVVKRQSVRWQNAVEGLSGSSAPTILPAPENFRGTLRDYQAYGYSWMSFLRCAGLGGVLADDMGLGKTVQALAFIMNACEKLEKTGGNKPFLIVAPTSVVENWASEIERFAPSLQAIVFRRGERSKSLEQMAHAQVVVTSYSLLGRDEAHFSKIHWDTLIADEAQFVKNHKSKAYAALRRLRSDCKIALTGTPMENNLMELWSVFSIGAPGLFPSPEKFQSVFRRPIEKEGRTDLLPLLRAYLKPFLLRRTKEKVEKELPPKIEQTLTLPMEEKQRQVYDVYLQRERQRVLGLLREGGLQKNRFEILTSLTRLRQLCLHAGLVDEKNKSVPSAKIEALVEHLRTILEENHKVLIFSQFTSFLSLVQKRLTKEKIRFSYLDGTTRDRKKTLEEFTQDKSIPVFLISLKAGGFGLNLTCADYCILLDPWWNPAVENQAIDRTHRIGQKNHVMVYRLIIQDSIEEKVLKLQEKKKALFKNVLEDGEIFSTLVTEEDIQNIFNLPKTF